MIWLLISVAAAAPPGVIGWWALRRLRIATVAGESMAPTFRHGDRVLIRRTSAGALRRGDVVMIAMATSRHESRQKWIIKRVAALPGDLIPAEVPRSPRTRDRVPAGMLLVLGDNPDFSIDSREFGYVPANGVFGRVTRRLARRGPARPQANLGSRV